MLSALSVSDLVTLLGLLGTAIVAFAKAIQWWISRLDAKTQAAIKLESDLRRTIEKSFEERIQKLEMEIEIQRGMISDMNREKQVYLRRIYQLESYLQISNLQVPAMEGWPP